MTETNSKIDLFKALLNKEFYNANKHRIPQDLFSDLLSDLFSSLVGIYDSNTSSSAISCRELYAVHCANNPVLTDSNKRIIIDLIKSINEAENLSPEIAKYVLDKALIEYKANEIARVALEISQGEHEDWHKLEQLLKQDVTQEDIQLVTTDIPELLIELAQGKYRYNLPDLDAALGAIQQGSLIVLAGPVNAGKSALAVSLVAAPKGFLEQGAKVLYIGNEEKLRKTSLRCASAYTGLTKDEMLKNPKMAQELWEKVRGGLNIIQDYSMTFNKLNHICEKMAPDIVVLDMIDKVGVNRTFQREDQRLGYAYEQGRETAKRFDCAVFGLSQTDAKSFGKLYYSFDHLHGSKVEKAANADTVITIGAQSTEFTAGVDNNIRNLNIAKSKDEGNGKTIICQIRPLISRFVP